jgi:hypothetical protein
VDHSRWPEIYEAAVLEADPGKRRLTIEAAEEIIAQRMCTLEAISPSNDEWQRIQNARTVLRMLKMIDRLSHNRVA